MKPRPGRARCVGMRYALVLVSILFAAPALAQDRQWTPAPVPSVGGGDNVLPAARAGERVTDDGSTPFSSEPSGSVAANGATSSNQTNDVGTPNLSK